MDPITVSVAVILGKYAMDKLGKYAIDSGVELGKEIGPKALNTAKDMFGMVLDRLRGDPSRKVIADEFEKDPETYQKPLEKSLEAEVQADPAFAAQLQSLVSQYEEAAKEYAVETGRTYQAIVTGSGAAAVGAGAVSAGAGGVAVGGSVQGGVSVGGQKPEEEKQ
jgi:hypothetical protein